MAGTQTDDGAETEPVRNISGWKVDGAGWMLTTVRQAWTDKLDGIVLFGDGIRLLDNWVKIPFDRDGTASYILAQWMEDHFADLLERNSRANLIAVIGEFYREASDPEHNHTGA